MIEHYETLKAHVQKGEPFTIPEMVDKIWPGLPYLDRRMRIERMYDCLNKDQRWGISKKIGRKSVGATRVTIWMMIE